MAEDHGQYDRQGIDHFSELPGMDGLVASAKLNFKSHSYDWRTAGPSHRGRASPRAEVRDHHCHHAVTRRRRDRPRFMTSDS
jgi:hypothetical protein